MRLRAPRIVIAVGMLLVLAVLLFASDNLTKNEASAVGCLRTLNTAEVTYAKVYAGKGYACKLATLGEPADGSKNYSADAAGFIDKTLASGERNGYKYQLTCSGAAPDNKYEVVAIPQDTKERIFCTGSTDMKIRTGKDPKTCATQGTPMP